MEGRGEVSPYGQARCAVSAYPLCGGSAPATPPPPYGGYMKHTKDPRINAGYWSVKEYLFLAFAMVTLSGFHMMIFLSFFDRGMMQTNVQLVINVLGGFVLLMAALYMGIIAVIRHVSWNRPMRSVSNAAKKIARGDFQVRIPPSRKDGKKDFVEVMFEDFNTMAQELAAIETLKNDFIANVSHEIKTPLAVIQGYAAALQNEALSANERREYATTILEATGKLSALVSNILKLNKLENQEIMPEAQPFSLDEQLRRCAVSFEEVWERKNITFDAELDETTVCYDESMLEIVWNNLLSNAIKFTNPGGSIMVRLKNRDGGAVVLVSDSGCGMDEATQKRIFDKFYQGDTSHAQEGNGLGLALAKKIIELIDGTITVESSPGQGAVFMVRLKTHNAQ